MFISIIIVTLIINSNNNYRYTPSAAAHDRPGAELEHVRRGHGLYTHITYCILHIYIYICAYVHMYSYMYYM